MDHTRHAACWTVLSSPTFPLHKRDDPSRGFITMEEDVMCDRKRCGCEKQKAPKSKPEECSAEQIKECHGDAKKHPCVEPAKGK